jgi:hypothetical protein
MREKIVGGHVQGYRAQRTYREAEERQVELFWDETGLSLERIIKEMEAVHFVQM